MFATFSGNSFFRVITRGEFLRFSFCTLSCGVLSRRTPVVLHFLSFPGKKGNEAKERNRRQIEIFLRSGVLGCSALPMLTSKETRNF